VTVGPPDFAPGVGNVVSLFDTLWDTAVREVSQPTSASATPLIARARRTEASLEWDWRAESKRI